MEKNNGKRRHESKLTHSLRANGYLFPTTTNQVNHLETNHKDLFKNIPPPLLSVDSILDRGIVSIQPIVINDINNEVAESLAQAAREGKEIPEGIRKQMQEDRKKANNLNKSSDS